MYILHNNIVYGLANK